MDKTKENTQNCKDITGRENLNKSVKIKQT